MSYEELEKTAKLYAEKHTMFFPDIALLRVGQKEAFEAGAKWMAGQYKTLGETEIYLEDDGGEAPYTQEWLDLATTEFAIPEGFKPGDKVVVQIRKAE